MKEKIKETVRKYLHFWEDEYLLDEEDFNTMIDELEIMFNAETRKTGVKDKNGREILFGDKIRFSDKFEWYYREYTADFWLGNKTREQIREEIEKRPYEERIVEDITDYEWLLDDDIQKYWEVV